MPNYPTHARWGRAGGVVAALAVGTGVYALFAAPLVAVAGALGAGVTTFVGSVYPDIDHHKSIPRRKAVLACRVLVALGVGSLAVANWDRLLAAAVAFDPPVAPVVVVATLVGVAVVAATALVDPVIGLVTRRHRGWTHSAPINLVLVAALAAGVWALTADLATPGRAVAVVVAASFYLGTLVHLGLDGEIL